MFYLDFALASGSLYRLYLAGLLSDEEYARMGGYVDDPE